MKKKIAIVYNPLAGVGKAVGLAEKAARYFEAEKVEFTLYTEQWPDQFPGYSDIMIVGGDGTLNYFINHYPDIKTPLFILNGGTGNDFHRMLYGKKSFKQLMQIILTGNIQSNDLGKCNERYFINGIGIGFEGAVTKALLGKKKWLGKMSFLVTILKTIISYQCQSYEIRYDQQTIPGQKLMISICNGRWVGGGYFIAPPAKADDGMFEIVLAEPLSSLQMLRWLPVIEKGKHLGLEFITHFQSKHLEIESNQPMLSHLDGEYMESMKMHIQIMPGRIQFRV